MNYKKLFEQSFKSVVPSKDSKAIMKSVIERTERTDMENTKKKGVKKPFVAVAAAAAAVALGVTGAAAAGIIDFNEIFGNEIKTEIKDSYLLMSRTENVEAYVSDEDYNVTLLGVTGGNDVAIMSIEISRKDGKPVTDYFVNRNDDSTMTGIISAECKWDNPDAKKRQYSNEWINEDGNISVNIELAVEFDYIEDTSLAGKNITVNGNGFYPAKDFYDYLDEIGAKYQIDGIGAVECVQYEDGTPADVSSVASLPLEWGLSFDYYPSEKSSAKLFMKEEDKNSTVTFRQKQMYYIDPDYPEIIEYGLEITDIQVGSTNAFIDIIEYKDSKPTFPFYSFPDNEICLITKGGEKIEMSSNGGVARANSEQEISREKLVYYSESPEQGGRSRLAIDVSEIAAISINGEIFELE
ncbi:MAG: hypothetical protein ACI4KR_13625 [Ruminiclostridium sp.]